jgi:hypothetical protein
MLRTSFAFSLISFTAAAPAQMPAVQAPAAPAAAARTPAPLQVPHPHYVVLPLSIDVNAPAEKVWARVGKFCDIGEWGIPNCTLLSGDGGLGSVRSIGNEIMVAQTRLSYTYTQPVREGAIYNLYHGTIEAVPLTPATTQIRYTFVYDNSMLADDAAREREITNRKARFGKMLENMKTLAEGGTLPPGALPGPANAVPAAAPR